ncbi:MAG: FixH family protein [Lysobacteraceae bacterium]
MSHHDTERRAHREPLLWLVVGLPLAAVIAGISTLVIAIRAGGADALPDPVRRTAQVQQLDLTPDHIAAAEQRHATLRRNGAELSIELSPETTDPLLLLQLIHPTDAAEDRQLALTRDGDAWRGQLPDQLPENDWRLQLVPADGRWRLHGRWRSGSNEVELAPALDRQ